MHEKNDDNGFKIMRTNIISKCGIVGRVGGVGDCEIKGHAHVIRDDGEAATGRVAGLNSLSRSPVKTAVHSVTKKNTHRKLYSTERKNNKRGYMSPKVQTTRNCFYFSLFSLEFNLVKRERSEASLQFNLVKIERSEASLQFYMRPSGSNHMRISDLSGFNHCFGL